MWRSKRTPHLKRCRATEKKANNPHASPAISITLPEPLQSGQDLPSIRPAPLHLRQVFSVASFVPGRT
jgi:hypothetical protein